jgi:hypothetical protein
MLALGGVDLLMRTLVVLLTLVVLASSGCDPGWGYRVPGATPIRDDGIRYRLEETGGVGGTVHGHLFAAGLTVEIDIVNRGISPLRVTPELLRAVDARGTPLPKAQYDDSQMQPQLVIAPDGTCRLRGDSRVNPLSGIVANRNLKIITVFVDGISRAEQPIPLQVRLEWE